MRRPRTAPRRAARALALALAVAALAGSARAQGGASSQLSITEARLDAFVAAMRPALDAEHADQARWRGEERRREARAAYAACVRDAEDTPMITSATPAVTREWETLDAVQRRLRVREEALSGPDAGGTGERDVARQAVLDSLELVEERVIRLRHPAARRCGAEVLPLNIAGAAAAAPAAGVRPAVPAGMTAVQFGVLRERVALWLTTSGRAAGFAPAEVAALTARRAALAPYAAQFREGGLLWRTWSDLDPRG